MAILSGKRGKNLSHNGAQTSTMSNMLTVANRTAEVAEIDAARKDPQKFAVLYERYYEPIFRFVYQRLDNKQQAFDTTAQVFLKAMLNLKTYRPMGLPFSSWLYRIARNELTDLFNKNNKTRTVNADTVGLGTMIEEIAEDPLEDYKGKLPTALNRLDEDELQLVEMRYFEKRPFAEIGQILDITENNAKVRLYRTLDKLKRIITTQA